MTYGFPVRKRTQRLKRSFNPNVVSFYTNLVCWYDASRETYTDDAGTLVAASGNSIAVMPDWSQYNRHMRQQGLDPMVQYSRPRKSVKRIRES